MFTDGCHAGAAPALLAQHGDRGDGVCSADPVGQDARVALEVDEGADRGRSENSVGTSAIETEVVQRLLEFDDVIATDLRSSERENAVAQLPTRLGES